jgi:hypothetical protein
MEKNDFFSSIYKKEIKMKNNMKNRVRIAPVTGRPGTIAANGLGISMYES